MEQCAFLPHLPSRTVDTVVISAEFPAIQKSLERRRIRVLTVEPCQNLALPVRSHADMQLLPLDESTVLISPYQDLLKAELEQLGIKALVGEDFKAQYPEDVPYNAVRVHHYCICNHKTVSPIAAAFWDKCHLQPIRVRQGYTKCSVCVVDEQSIITSDLGIAKSAQTAGLDVLTISPGFIKLPGYDTGFIGGCTGKLSQNCMAFTGRLDSHPDAEAIRCFLRQRKIEPVELCNQPLTDIGSIIPIH